MKKYICINIICICISLFLPSVLSACDPEPGPQHFPPPAVPNPVFKSGYFEVHNSLNGLPCNRIRSVLALQNAVLAGTEGGGLLILRDGTWRTYSPKTQPAFPSETVTALAPDAEANSVLAGTPNGLVRISDPGAEIRFEIITRPTPDGANVLSVVAAGQAIRAGTDAVAGTVSGGQFVPYRIDGDRQPTGFGAAANHDGMTWFGTSLGLYCAREGMLFPALFPGTDVGWVQGLAPLGGWLLAASSKGLFAVKGNTATDILPGIWTTCAAAPGDTLEALTSAMSPSASRETPEEGFGSLVAQNQESQALLAEMRAEYDRVSRLYQSGSAPTWDTLIAYNENLMRLSQRVQVVSEPLVRGIWAGTQSQGVVLFGTDGKRRHLTAGNSKLPENRITCVSCRDDGETWIGTYESGLLRYTRYVTSQSLEPVPVWQGEALTMRVIGEYLYVGTKGCGLQVFDVKSLQPVAAYGPQKPDGFHSNVYSIAADGRARVWTGGNAGVWMLDDAGWHRFTTREGIPADTVTCIEADADGRVYATGGGDCPLSQQLALFTGSGFTRYEISTLKEILSRQGKAASDTLRALQMGGGYQRSFDASQATQSLSLFDPNPVEEAVSTMLGTEHYLMLGVGKGRLYVFDGEAFKPVSARGTGDLNRLAGLGRKACGDVVILGRKSCLLFDGLMFTPTLPPDPAIGDFTSLALDQKNPDLFWGSFTTGAGTGGIALYQHPLWNVFPLEKPVRKLVISEPFGFLLTPDGVYRIML
ncbi:hypothetical protein KBA41_07890 [Candidatus Ozemobacteraceae bacterium]|nr:hypothetical protein [Candidatus Ozemobacteraceae bacterium]